MGPCRSSGSTSQTPVFLVWQCSASLLRAGWLYKLLTACNRLLFCCGPPGVLARRQSAQLRAQVAAAIAIQRGMPGVPGGGQVALDVKEEAMATLLQVNPKTLNLRTSIH